MIYFTAFVLTTLVGIEARVFNNPILSDRSYYSPSAIKVNGTYYVVSGILLDMSNEQLPIYTSTDLIEWKSAGYIFDTSNKPTWSNENAFYYPVIQQIGQNFVVCFSAFNKTTFDLEVGVASAPHPLGPYSVIDKPLLSQRSRQVGYPSIINDEDKLYLVWSLDQSVIFARQLNPDGLSFSSEETTTILEPSFYWENGFVYAPWHIRRNNYHYLIYTANRDCEKNVLAVARSSNLLGPYEKLPQPIISRNKNYTCLEDGSVVKDLDDQSDLVIFQGSNSILLASLSWDSDDWPKVGDF